MEMTLRELKNIVAEMESKNLTRINLDVTATEYYGNTYVDTIDFDIVADGGGYGGTIFTLSDK